MTTGVESKISKYNLEEVTMDLFSRGWSYQKICDKLNKEYFSKNSESISLMAVHRWIQTRRREFETECWNSNYELATLNAKNRGMESLNRLGKELILLFDLLYRTKSVNASDKRYLNRHKEEFISRIQQTILDFGFISNSIRAKEECIREMLLEFSRMLSPESRVKVQELLENDDYEARIERAKERCKNMYKEDEEK